MVEGGDYDGSGCKILVRGADGKAEFFVPSSQVKGVVCINSAHNDRIGQYRNMVVWVKRPKKGKTQWNFLVPRRAEVEQKDGVTFVRIASTWIAIRGANASFSGIDAKRAQNFSTKDGPLPGNTLAGDAVTEGFSGFALEVGEAKSHGDYESFKSAILSKSVIDASAIADGKVVYTGTAGKTVGIQWADSGLPKVWCDGKEHDFAQHRSLWAPSAGGNAPVSLGWKQGTLHVEAGGHSFTGRMNLETGTYSFENAQAK